MATDRNGFSGFLDGYKAQNLENVSDSANYQIKQIKELVVKLINHFRESKISSMLNDALMISFSPQSLITFGEIVKSLIMIDKIDSLRLRENSDFKLLILDYMNIAKISADSQVVDLALEIGKIMNC
jgi:hypothetical protein